MMTFESRWTQEELADLKAPIGSLSVLTNLNQLDVPQSLLLGGCYGDKPDTRFADLDTIRIRKRTYQRAAQLRDWCMENTNARA